LLALKALQCSILKAYQSHNSDREFTISHKYIFNVYQITTSGRNSNFSGEDTDKNTAQNAPKHSISSEKFDFFSGEGA